jgi:uncharacterized membrane protein YfcA
MTAPRSTFLALGAASLIGGAIGAGLLLITKDATFVALVPWLLLVASAVFTWAGQVVAAAPKRGVGQPPLAALTLIQLFIAVYGGYFGGGMGILMLAAFSLLGFTRIHEANGLKTLLGVLINGVGAATFVAAGAVSWAPAIVMIAGSLFGGYAAAAGARRLPPLQVRSFALAVAWCMTAYFMFDTYVKRHRP